MNRAERRAAAQAAAKQAAQAPKPAAQEPVVEQQQQDSEPSNERPPEWRPEPRNEPRRLAMEEMERLDLERKGLVEPKSAETVKEDLPPPTPESMLQGGKFSEAQEEPAKEEPVKEEAAPASPVKVETVRVKVDGEEYDAPKADVEAAGGITAYQRDKAAENRLTEARKALAEAKRLQAEIAQEKLKAHPPEPVLTDDQFIVSKIDEIRFGTPEQSAAALRSVLQRTSGQGQSTVVEAIANMKYESAREGFAREYGDVLANPLLAKLAFQLERESVAPLAEGGRVDWQKMAQVDWTRFFTTIGTQVRGLVGKPSQPAQTPKPDGNTSQPDREARKASIVNPPGAASRAELPKEEKPETREQMLAKVRAARGLPTG